jgi:hypothetical protein
MTEDRGQTTKRRRGEENKITNYKIQITNKSIKVERGGKTSNPPNSAAGVYLPEGRHSIIPIVERSGAKF